MLDKCGLWVSLLTLPSRVGTRCAGCFQIKHACTTAGSVHARLGAPASQPTHHQHYAASYLLSCLCCDVVVVVVVSLCPHPQDTALPDAFKLAAAADPDAKLCLNDLSLIEAHNSPRLIEIVQKHLRAHGAPIHCIGIQAHFEEYGAIVCVCV